jgi:hypothetical protein
MEVTWDRWSRDSSVGIVSGCWLDGWRSNLCRDNIFLFSKASKPALGPTQNPIKWVPGTLSPILKQATHLNLVPRSRMVELHIHSPIRLHCVILN